MKRVLVTGANGFVGRAIVDALLKEPDLQVIVTFRSTGDTLAPLSNANGRVAVLPGIDLADVGSVARLPAELTYVVHAAALARFEGASDSELYRSNVEGARILLEHLRRTSGRTLKRLLFTSTIGVHDRPRFYDPAQPIREDSPCSPVSRYGATKLSAERLVRLSGLPYVIARLAWVYGPTMRRDSHIRVLADMCKRRHPLTRVDFPGRVSVAYITDLAEALRALLLKETLSHPVFLVAHREPVSFGEMFSLSHHLLGRDRKDRRSISLRWATTPLRLAAPLLPMKLRSLVEDYYVCSVERLEAEGIRLSTPFAEGIRQSMAVGRWFET